jgi:hypothetical protein
MVCLPGESGNWRRKIGCVIDKEVCGTMAAQTTGAAWEDERWWAGGGRRRSRSSLVWSRGGLTARHHRSLPGLPRRLFEPS